MRESLCRPPTPTSKEKNVSIPDCRDKTQNSITDTELNAMLPITDSKTIYTQQTVNKSNNNKKRLNVLQNTFE